MSNDTLDLIARWEAETPGITHDGITSAVGPRGTWRVWSRTGAYGRGSATAREFAPGDTIMVGSFNLAYLATLTKATDKTVIFLQYGKTKKALARKLSRYNCDLNLERERRRNAEWTD
jgi:hypothetical protein